ncbi:hypothetical protein THASP1DRAFT_30090 [Thamnocephalis sphaerospora]|uniref:Ankyrin repeat-containing domain protein n=1 Tax=Thamnocephalis sphaerospora TaxID=78915 RepID=A0A4P9XQ03_9FUNG|nr:hypothetical protein THASP1DRAFT_30090 [Thamnocephalis sphaerospora]|eukprot:RKP08103.1 hypothetical protein THASP1DRAFT_30090 [Thamnocephalis sphaerospora]
MSERFASSDRGIKGLRRRSREVKGLVRRALAEFEELSVTAETGTQTSLDGDSGCGTLGADAIVTRSGDASAAGLGIGAVAKEADTAVANVLEPLLKQTAHVEVRSSSPSSSAASVEEDSDTAIIHQLQQDVLAAVNAESRSRLAGVLAVADPSLCLQAMLSFAAANRDLTYHHDPDVQHDADELLGRSVANLNALHIACFLGEEDIACDLVDYVARVTKAMDARKVLYEFLGRVWGGGNTALHLASFSGMDALVKRLLDLGANMNKRNERKYKAVDCADDDATRKLFLDMMQGTVIRIPMRRTVSMDDVFHGDMAKSAKISSDGSGVEIRVPPSSERQRVLYKLPAGARSATTMRECSDGDGDDNASGHSSVSASNTRSLPLQASERPSTLVSSASAGFSASTLTAADKAPPPKKRTIGRLIEALSTQFRAMGGSDGAGAQHSGSKTGSGSTNADRLSIGGGGLAARNRVGMVANKSNNSVTASSSSCIAQTINETDEMVPRKKEHLHGKGQTTNITFDADGAERRHGKSVDHPTSTAVGQANASAKTTVGKDAAGTGEKAPPLADSREQRSKRRRAAGYRVRFDPAVTLLDAARTGDTPLVRASLDAGIHPDHQSAHRCLSALHLAASYDHLDVCRLLVDRGAALNIRDLEGWTPLHCAAAEGHLRVVNYLLGHGTVDVTLGNADDETAEDVAEEDRVRSVLHAAIAAATANAGPASAVAQNTVVATR